MNGSSCPGGTTNLLSTARMPQYRMLTRTSRGVAHAESMFFSAKSCLLREMSARRPTPNVIVDIVSAMMVRNWYEPPNPLCRGFVILGSHENDAANNASPTTWMVAERLLGEEVSLRRACVVIVGYVTGPDYPRLPSKDARDMNYTVDLTTNTRRNGMKKSGLIGRGNRERD